MLVQQNQNEAPDCNKKIKIRNVKRKFIVVIQEHDRST